MLPFSAGTGGMQFVLTATTTTFGITAASSPQVEYFTFAARLTGARNVHYGCLMDGKGVLKTADTGEIYFDCPDVELLDADVYNVSIILLKHPFIANTSKCFSHGEFSNILDYVYRRNFTTVDEFRECFNLPMQRVVEFFWNKSKEILSASSSEATCGPGLDGPPGRWLSVAQTVGSQFIDGLDDELPVHEINLEREMSHVFLPFTCHYKFFSKLEAASCLAQIKPIFIGDSRDFYLVGHIRDWLTLSETEKSIIDHEWWIHKNIGLRPLLESQEGREKTLESLLNLLDQNRTIIIDSVLHDVGSIGPLALVDDVLEYYPTVASAMDLQHCNKTQPLGWCKGFQQQDKDAYASLPGKRYAVQIYKQNISHLRDLILRAKNIFPNARIYWLTHHKRPPVPADITYGWSTNDILYSLEEMAAEILSAANVPHIDLRPMAIASPPSWWDDTVHYGRTSPKSMFKHMALQIVLNRICPV